MPLSDRQKICKIIGICGYFCETLTRIAEMAIQNPSYRLKSEVLYALISEQNCHRDLENIPDNVFDLVADHIVECIKDKSIEKIINANKRG